MRPIPLACASALASAVLALTGCGGGGDGPDDTAANTPAPATTLPAPAEPVVSYLVNGEGGVATLNIGVDASGSFTQGTTRYQLQTNGALECTISSNPADPNTVACNVLADGKGFLLCENTLSPHFNYTFFRQSEAQMGTHWELGGKTLTGLSCGTAGPRITTYSFSFSSDAESAVEHAGPATNMYGAGIPDLYEQPAGYGVGQFHERFAIYKIKSGATTQYFLLVLHQIDDPIVTPRPVNLYFLQM
jgi:hypothetical protein